MRPTRGAEVVPVRPAIPPPRYVQPHPSRRSIADWYILCGREARLYGDRKGRPRASCFRRLWRNRHRPDCGMTHRDAPRKEEQGTHLQPVGLDRRRYADTGRNVRYIASSMLVSRLLGCSRCGIMTHGKIPRQFSLRARGGWFGWSREYGMALSFGVSFSIIPRNGRKLTTR